MKFLIVLPALLAAAGVRAQELFPYTEPASNMPARSVAAKLAGMYMPTDDGVVRQRYAPEIMLAPGRKWMAHGALTFSDMNRGRFGFEAVRVYTKYRFLSIDGVHKHFRAAAFGAAAFTRSPSGLNDAHLWGDASGAQGGLIVTQLLNRVAVSATGAIQHTTSPTATWAHRVGDYARNAIPFSLSAGMLLLPRVYSDYRQTNLNLYVELLGQRALGVKRERFYADLAPSMQLIFNSRIKVNVGYRFEIGSDMQRMSRTQWMVSFERVFLSALARKKADTGRRH